MAIVDATRELEPREARRDRLGWQAPRRDARHLRAAVRRDRLLLRPHRRTRAQGLGADRVREALQSPARRPRLGAGDGAQHLRLADRPRARRALLRALHPRGRLDRALDRDHRPRPHDVGRDQVHGPKRVGGQPDDPSRRHLRQQRPGDRRRPQRRRADLRPDLTGRASWSPGPEGSPTYSTSAHRPRAGSRSGRRTGSTTESTCHA